VEPDVVVVGGGAIGVSAAYELARRGARVTLLERADRLASGCSAGNAGLICPSHSLPLATPAALREVARSLLGSGRPLSVRPRPGTLHWLGRFALACRGDRAERGRRAVETLSLASLELHAELAALGTSFERRGILSVYETEAGLAAARGEVERSRRGEVLPAEAAVRYAPALRRSVAGAVLHADEANVDPLRYVEAIAAAAAAAGVELRTRAEVRGLRRLDSSVAVRTVDGELRPRAVVMAAGAWSARLLDGVGLSLPVTGGKGYHVDLARGDGDPSLPILLPEARCAVTPLGGRLRLTGTVEICGLDLRLNRSRIGVVRGAAASVLGDAGERETLGVWAGLRPCAPDGLPVIGRSERLPGVVFATGHAMKGISLAPVTARLAAELVAGESPSHDLAPFSPDRFQLSLQRR
jgi:D-amino-acid dehydrogenase